jgi:hypothetical protein
VYADKTKISDRTWDDAKVKKTSARVVEEVMDDERFARAGESAMNRRFRGAVRCHWAAGSGAGTGVPVQPHRVRV